MVWMPDKGIRNEQGAVVHVLLAQGSGAVCSDPRSLSLPQRFCEWCVVISLILPLHQGVGIDGSAVTCAFSVEGLSCCWFHWLI